VTEITDDAGMPRISLTVRYITRKEEIRQDLEGTRIAEKRSSTTFGDTLMTPSYFWVQTAPPRDGHPGAIAEGHYIVEEGTVTLTHVIGNPLPGERHKRKLEPADDEMVVLGSCCAARHRDRGR
jgi:hypothetical protein